MSEARLKGRLQEILVHNVDASGRARTDYGADFEAFKASVSERLLHPIAVMEQGNFFILLAGARRLRAAIELGWERIEAKVFPPLNRYEQKLAELVENTDRKELTYIERARNTLDVHNLYQEIYGKGFPGTQDGHSIADTARILGVSTATVFQELEIATLAEKVPELARCAGKLEALKLIEKVKAQMKVEEAVLDYERRSGIGNIDQARKNIAASYVVGDFFDEIKKIQTGSIELSELDPPYGIDLSNVKKQKTIVGTLNYSEVACTEYPQFILLVCKELFRVSATNSWVLAWCSYQHFETTALALEAAGFSVNRVPNIWVKGRGQTMSPASNLASCHYCFFSARKGGPTIVKQGRSNVFTCPPVITQSKTHPTERPVQLLEEILSTFINPGASVLVPFAGSGSTIFACANLKMPVIGFDLSVDYRNEFVKRVYESIPGLYTSSLETSGGL